MTRERGGKACKICDRPFTVYRWQPGSNARFKKTELCITCAKMKNVCQTCVLDLQYGLPVQVRDSVLEEHERMSTPISDVNREFMIESIEREMANGGAHASGLLTGELSHFGAGYGKAPSAAAHKALEGLRKKEPYYQRNRAHICSFFVKGTCNRGKNCPYRHEMPVTGELSQQNIRDRYIGQNDPVARKLMNRAEEKAKVGLSPPEDPTITTLWIGGIEAKMSEEDIRSKFMPYGAMTLRLVPTKNCAFVTYATRQGAENAARNLAGKLIVDGVHLRMSWGKRSNTGSSAGAGASLGPATVPGSAAPVPYPGAAAPAMPPPGSGPMLYPSQDPKQLAAKLPVG